MALGVDGDGVVGMGASVAVCSGVFAGGGDVAAMGPGVGVSVGSGGGVAPVQADRAAMARRPVHLWGDIVQFSLLFRTWLLLFFTSFNAYCGLARNDRYQGPVWPGLDIDAWPAVGATSRPFLDSVFSSRRVLG